MSWREDVNLAARVEDMPSEEYTLDMVGEVGEGGRLVVSRGGKVGESE